MADSTSTALQAINVAVNVASTSLLTAEQVMLEIMESLHNMASSKNEYRELAGELANGKSLLATESYEDAQKICEKLKEEGVRATSMAGVGCGIISVAYGGYEKAQKAVQSYYEDAAVKSAINTSMRDEVASSIAASEIQVTNLKSGEITNSALKTAVEEENKIIGCKDPADAYRLAKEMKDQGVQARTEKEGDTYFVVVPKGQELRSEEIRSVHYIAQAEKDCMRAVREYFDQPKLGGEVGLVQLDHYDSENKDVIQLNMPRDHAMIMESKLKQDKIPYVLNQSSEKRVTITYAKIDEEKAESLQAETAVRTGGRNSQLYLQQSSWRNQYNRQIREVTAYGEFPNGQNVKPGSTLVNDQEQMISFQRRYVAVQDGAQIRCIPKGRSEDIQKVMNQYMRDSKDVALLTAEEYGRYKTADAAKKKEIIYQKEREGSQGLIARPALKKKELEQIAEEQRRQVAVFVRLSQDGYPTSATRQMTMDEAKEEFGLTEKEVKQLESLNVGVQPSKPEEISDDEINKIEKMLDVEIDGKPDQLSDTQWQKTTRDVDEMIALESTWEEIVTGVQDLMPETEEPEFEAEKGEETL